MKDTEKTKEQLIQELIAAREQITKLETVVAELEQIRDDSFKAQFSIDHAPQGVFWIRSDGSFAYANDTACHIMGYSREELLTMSVFDIDPALPRETWPELWQQVRENKVPVFETQHQTKDGRVISVEILANYLEYEGQEYNCTFNDDITERKQAEAERERLQQEIIETQQRSIQELSTPVIPIMDQIIVIPLIGSIDSMRARDITRSLLAGISQNRAKVVILDVTGVPLIDSGVANHLNKTIQAARLKGAQTIVTGISDAVAEAIVDLGINWSEITTLSDLQTGLIVALRNVGVRLSKT